MEIKEQRSFTYDESQAYDYVKKNITEENGVPIEDYLEEFGYPTEVEAVKVDPSDWHPPLPGMEGEASPAISSLGDYERRLEELKLKEFRRVKDAAGLLVDKSFVLLTEDEAEAWLATSYAKSDVESVEEDIWEDFESDLHNLIGGHEHWSMGGSNMNWRGASCSEEDIESLKAKELLRKLSCYSPYTPTLTWKSSDENFFDCDEFTLTFQHHDCPVSGSSLTFTKRK